MPAEPLDLEPIKAREQAALILEGVAAQLYQREKHRIGQASWWWSVLSDDVRAEWREKAKALLASGKIAG